MFYITHTHTHQHTPTHTYTHTGTDVDKNRFINEQNFNFCEMTEKRVACILALCLLGVILASIATLKVVNLYFTVGEKF